MLAAMAGPIANRAHPLSCIKLAFNGGAIVWTGRAASMRRFAMKALFTALALRRAEKERIDWDRNILIFSTVVTIGLIALYVYGKATSRW
jgi:hypothetical protein